MRSWDKIDKLITTSTYKPQLSHAKVEYLGLHPGSVARIITEF